MKQTNLICTFELISWEEIGVREAPQRITQTTARYKYTEGVLGSSEVRFLMSYDPNGEARFCGLEVLEGSYQGSGVVLVIEHRGEFKAGEVRGEARVIQAHSTGVFRERDFAGSLRCLPGEAYTLALRDTSVEDD